jgi:hypothetical protein
MVDAVEGAGAGRCQLLKSEGAVDTVSCHFM